MNRGMRRKAIEQRHRAIEKIRIPCGEICDAPALLEAAEKHKLSKTGSARWPYPYLVRLSDRSFHIGRRAAFKR